MRSTRIRSRTFYSLLFAALAATMPMTVQADDDGPGRGPGLRGVLTYRITVHNINVQPVAPPVAATHAPWLRIFKPNQLASPELEILAETGDPSYVYEMLLNADGIGEVVKFDMPLTPYNTKVGDFTDASTFLITGLESDRFSLAGMLGCTNDGFTGLNSVKLPNQGSRVYMLRSWDAGTEDNTEISTDLADGCSVLGLLPLRGDPNGNENDAVDTLPRERIRRHPGVLQRADLRQEEHGWMDPVVKVTATRIHPEARTFSTRLHGFGELPYIDTEAEGRSRFDLRNSGTALQYQLGVEGIKGVTMAHIHLGLPNMAGPVVAFLYGPTPPTDYDSEMEIASGMITVDNLVGPLAGNWAGFLQALRNGELYVNVHTTTYPAGEIRGQIGVTGR